MQPATIQPGPMPTIPGTESWGDKYGAIGVVAALAIAALVLWILQFVRERREDRDRQNKETSDLAKQVTALNEKLVETMDGHHRETLKLVADLTRENETRYQVLLDRHIAETRSNAEALRAQAMATSEALGAMVKKLSKNAE